MKRSDFLRICATLGIGLPFASALKACNDPEEGGSDFAGTVTIIGAGPAGLAAGYLLKQRGIDFRIIEADSQFGGRTRINRTFADFPVPLGAEWIETNPQTLRSIVNDDAIAFSFQTFEDEPDHKFRNFSWFQFFETYIVPSIREHIVFGQPVKSIDYNGDRVRVATDSAAFTADKVIVCVPLQVLKDGDISFSPELPERRRNLIQNMPVWAGFKAFFEFGERFYEPGFSIEDDAGPQGQKAFYDLGFGQSSSRHFIGLFSVGSFAEAYLNLSDEALKNRILQELDGPYNGLASRHYLRHISQNWNAEPFIRSGYLSDHADWREVRELSSPLGDKVYFAGGEFTDGEDWVSVHTAAAAARQVVDGL